jgi:Rhodopirellula transposase DDE domain
MVYCAKKNFLGGTMMELTDTVKELLLNTAKVLKGDARRMFMARTVQALGKGGQRLAEHELGWNRGTIRKGMHELEHGIVCIDAFSLRGRKRAEDHLPNLLSDLTAIVDGQSQADPQFRTNRLYTRMTATEVRRQLMRKFSYSDDALPTAETIATKLNELGYYPKKVAKSQPQKKSPRPTPSLPK